MAVVVSMRGVTLVLIALFGLVHVELWFGHSGVPRVMELRAQMAEQQALNEQARARNERLQAEVTDLQTGREIIEEKARAELGMVRPNELLVQYTGGKPR
jgi:cell division protein FtsB